MEIKKKGARALTGKKKPVKKKINFEIAAPEAKNVFLAGDFNGWDRSANPLHKNSKGVWKTSLVLMPGTYQYRFLVDGAWQNDPRCTTLVSNPYGSDNCILKVGEE